MIVPQNWEFNTDEQISDDEHKVLNKFLDQYRDKDVIVADKHREDFNIVPIEGEEVAFKSNDCHWKSLDFQRRIVHEGKPYIVRLGLWRTNPGKDEAKCLTMSGMDILTPGKQHVLSFNTNDFFQNKLFYNIIDIFDEKKIISPEAAYSKRMYTNKELQRFMNERQFGKIIEGVNQKPSLANALFIMGEPTKSYSNFNIRFATILYQLINYRKEHESELSNRKLHELDRAILKLSKTELLKVHLRDDTGVTKSYPTGSILLDYSYNSIQMRISEQANVGNGELMEEKKSLNKVLRQFRNR